MSKAKEWGGYSVEYFKNGQPRLAGPRASGPHPEVWDRWSGTTDKRGFPDPPVSSCKACGAEWTAGESPETCEPK